jgi:hypothetical protein
MGNHEYCTDCGANDFHHGRPCDPDRLAKKKAKEDIQNKAQADALKRLVALKEQLESQGIKVQWDWHGEGLVIYWWDN